MTSVAWLEPLYKELDRQKREYQMDDVTLIIERVAMDADPTKFSPKSGISTYKMTHIPRDWKIVFGAATETTGGYNDGPFCLRVFEDEDKLRAVIFNVVGFRAEELGWEEVDKDNEG